MFALGGLIAPAAQASQNIAMRPPLRGSESDQAACINQAHRSLNAILHSRKTSKAQKAAARKSYIREIAKCG